MRSTDPVMIGSRIRAFRGERGLTQFALAVRSGLSLRAITKYEAGLAAPGSPALARLADALGVATDAFFVAST